MYECKAASSELSPAGQLSSEYWEHRAAWLHLQEAGSSLQGAGFCYRAWSKMWYHRGFEIRKRPPPHVVMINYVNESLSQEPNAFSSCPGCSIPFGLQKFPPGQFPSLSKEENWRVQTHMLVIYSLGNLVSLFGTATHTHTYTHIRGPTTWATTVLYNSKRCHWHRNPWNSAAARGSMESLYSMFPLDFPTDHGQSRIHFPIKSHH